VPYESSRVGDNIQIRMGDPDKTVTGRQRFVITYVVSGGLDAQPEWDEFYWDVTGTGWDVTILSATARVVAPQIERIQCFEGPLNSTDPCNSGAQGSDALFEATNPLQPHSNLSVDVALTKGAVSVPPPQLREIKSGSEQVEDFIGPDPIPLFFTALLGIAAPVALGRYWWLHGRDKWFGDVHYLTASTEERTKPLFAKDTVVVEYTPPEIPTGRQRKGRALRSAEIGTLMDESADTVDVTSTMVDLAVRGYLRITEMEKT
jgi:hypothetical protein